MRFDFYRKRKEFQMKLLKKEAAMLENKSRFITELISGDLKIQNKPKDEVVKILQSRNYKSQTQIEDSPTQNKDNFDYLLSMSFWSLTQERVEQLR